MNDAWRRLALFAAALSLAAPADSRPLDTVRASGVLDVSVYADFPPWAYEEGGRLVGIDVEIGAALAREIGVGVNHIVRQAGETVDDDLRVNVWRGDIVEHRAADVMMHVPVDKQLKARTELAAICCAYFEETVAVAVDPRAIKVESFAPFRHRKIAVEVDTVSDFFLTGAFGGQLMPGILRGLTFEKAAEAFWSGEADALMATRAQAEWAIARSPHPAALKQPPTPGIVRSSWPVGLAIRADSRDLGYALGEALERLAASGALAAIFERHGVSYTPVPVD